MDDGGTMDIVNAPIDAIFGYFEIRLVAPLIFRGYKTGTK